MSTDSDSSLSLVHSGPQGPQSTPWDSQTLWRKVEVRRWGVGPSLTGKPNSAALSKASVVRLTSARVGRIICGEGGQNIGGGAGVGEQLLKHATNHHDNQHAKRLGRRQSCRLKQLQLRVGILMTCNMIGRECSSPAVVVVTPSRKGMTRRCQGVTYTELTEEGFQTPRSFRAGDGTPFQKRQMWTCRLDSDHGMGNLPLHAIGLTGGANA